MPGRPYDVGLTPKARRALDDLEPRDFERVDARVLELAVDPRPHGVEKLAADLFRVRVGDWRVIYLIDDAARQVVVVAVKRRNERTYRNL